MSGQLYACKMFVFSTVIEEVLYFKGRKEYIWNKQSKDMDQICNIYTLSC